MPTYHTRLAGAPPAGIPLRDVPFGSLCEIVDSDRGYDVGELVIALWHAAGECAWRMFRFAEPRATYSSTSPGPLVRVLRPGERVTVEVA